MVEGVVSRKAAQSGRPASSGCRGFFVTGTDTNVGKTVLSALLCTGLSGRYWKPIQTGAREGTDRAQILSWTEMSDEQGLAEVYLFDEPVSPHLAARTVGQEIRLEAIVLPKGDSDRPLIVEGAGGVMVPINSMQFMRDLMRHLGLPVILACRSTLGTINHTLMSLQSLRTPGLNIRGVVMIGPPNKDNEAAIERYGDIAIIGRIPQLPEINCGVLRQVFANSFDHKSLE